MKTEVDSIILTYTAYPVKNVDIDRAVCLSKKYFYIFWDKIKDLH